MKKLLLTLMLLLSQLYAFAETVKPTYDVKIDRPVSLAVIEGVTYYNVVVELDAGASGGVKITVKDASSNKKIYKKKYSKSYLYGFSDGSIQVGKGNALTQLILHKSSYSGDWLIDVREKGLY